MPEMNGLEFIKILKRDFPEIKILVLSMFHNMQPIKDIDGFLFSGMGIKSCCYVTRRVRENTKVGTRRVLRKYISRHASRAQ